MKIKRYEKYKDSGIPWIGEIPEHWEVKKLKYCIKKIETGKREHTDKEEIYSIGGEHIGTDGKVHLSNPKFVSKEFYNNYKKGKIKQYDILIVKDGATIGKTAFVDFNPANKMMVNEHVYRVEAHKYYYYFFLSSFFQKIIWKENQSSAQEGLPQGTILNIPSFFIPSLREQSLIADYLDRKTAEIDELIAKKEQLLELYEEEKKAIINKAVTKGINPNVKMKDSGIPWLGKIPEHWEVKKLKYVAEIILGKMLTTRNKGKYYKKKYLRAANVEWLKVNVSDVKEMWFSKDELTKLRLKYNDLIVSEGGEVGRTCIWKNEILECYIQNSVHKITINDKYNPTFLLYLFFIYGHKGFFEAIVNRISIAHLTREKLKEMLFPFPPFEEQQEIVNYIEKQISIIDSKIEKTKKVIELLKEYKTSLISEVVTGKRKVIE